MNIYAFNNKSYTLKDLTALSEYLHGQNCVGISTIKKRLQRGETDLDEIIKPKVKAFTEIDYSPIFYVADFETSSNLETNECGAYLACVVKANFNKGLSTLDSWDVVEPCFDCRYPKDLGDYFYTLYKQAEKRKKRTLIFFHNLGFDFSFARNWESLMGQLMITKSFSDGSNPWRLAFGDGEKVWLEIRCSLKLLHRSVGSIGDMIGHPKLGYDYNEFRLPTDKLEKYDYEYCYNDCKVTACGIMEECKNWFWIKNIKDIPLTFTSFTRKNNKAILSSELEKAWSNYCVDTFPMNFDQYQIMRGVYQGAYTHANTFFRGKLCTLVHSFDVCSDYPSQSTQMDFPDTNGELYVNEPLRNLWNGLYEECIESSLLDDVEAIKMRHVLVSGKMFHGIFTLKNIKIKNYGYNYMPIISASKTKSKDGLGEIEYNKKSHGYKLLEEMVSEYNRLIDNGRIISYDECTIYATEVDIVNILKMYDIESISAECLFLNHAKSTGGINELVERNIIYANMKTALKAISNGKRPDETLLNSIPEKWLSDIKSNAEPKKLAKRYLMLSKNMFNAQYGIDATQLVFGDTLIDEDCITSNTESLSRESFERYYNETMIKLGKERSDRGLFRRVKSSYIVGIYITAYARRHLVLFSHLIFTKTPYIIVYWDTDSAKLYHPNESAVTFKNLLNVVVEFNNGVMERCRKSKHPQVQENKWGLGKFDYEETYAYFTALNSKRYMTFDGELDVKTSGLVQATMKVSVVLDYLYKNSESWLLSFKALMRIMWKTNTMFDQSVSGRTYLDRQNQGKWSDEFGQYCGAVIKNTDYEFKMPMKKGLFWTNEKSAYLHYDEVSEYVFGNKLDAERTTFYMFDEGIGIVYYLNGKRNIMFCPCDISKFKHGILLSDSMSDLTEDLA